MKVKIGYLEYNLKFVERMPEGHDNLDGLIDYCRQEIVIKDDGNQTDDYLNYVIYHEIAHGMLYQMGESNTESNADRLAHMIYQTFGSFKERLSFDDLMLQIKKRDNRIKELEEAIENEPERLKATIKL